MNAKDIENGLKAYSGGAMFITLKQISEATGYQNIDRDIKPLVEGLEIIAINQERKPGRPSGRYFVPDVAKRIYSKRYFK